MGNFSPMDWGTPQGFAIILCGLAAMLAGIGVLLWGISQII